jgi:hypothetical protein
MTSTRRLFASAKTSPITGSAPWAPVPTMSRLPPQGMFSSAESGVWPYSSRNCFEGPFFRFRTFPPSITTSCVYRVPSTSISPNLISRALISQCSAPSSSRQATGALRTCDPLKTSPSVGRESSWIIVANTFAFCYWAFRRPPRLQRNGGRQQWLNLA